jgi:hypothetical protein
MGLPKAYGGRHFGENAPVLLFQTMIVQYLVLLSWQSIKYFFKAVELCAKMQHAKKYLGLTQNCTARRTQQRQRLFYVSPNTLVNLF